VQLLVYADNVRAIALYRRLGWQPAGEPAPHPRTGKPEQRYELALQKRHGPSAPRPFRQR
jgi:ribosomal protein S18 acetylase RimI-like enzyme